MTHGCHAERKNGSAASELRCRCAWLHHGSGPRTYRIQGCGATAPESGLPSDRHPDHTERAVVLEAVKVWPRKGEACRKVGAPANLDSSCARRPGAAAGRDEETGFQIEQRNRRMTKTCVALPNSLTKEAPYKGHPPVLTSPNPLSTLLQRFACARLSRPCLPESRPGVSATLTTTAFDRSSLRWLEIST